METTIQGGINRIIGEYGGVCPCAACHVYIEEIRPVNLICWRKILNLCACDLYSVLRLGCHIQVDESLDDLIVYVP